jgi:hypothetical protein
MEKGTTGEITRMDNSGIDINKFAKWALEEYGIKLKVPDAKYVEYLLGRREEPKYTRHKRKPMLRKLLTEFEDGT